MEDNLNNDIQYLIANYGFKSVHTRLLDVMRDEYLYMNEYFKSMQPAQVPAVVPLAQAPGEVPKPLQLPVQVQVKVPTSKKARKIRVSKAALLSHNPMVEPNINSDVTEPQPEPVNEIKEITLVPPQEHKGYPDPKVAKENQKKAEEAKKKDNDALGILTYQVLTKENLVKWIEEEGHTYAWVAREHAGCAETQVAATAQMMGIKSKISKKRGMIMNGK